MVQKITQEPFTTEELKSKYHNLFDMANYAIEIARMAIRQNNPLSLQELLEKLDQKTEQENP